MLTAEQIKGLVKEGEGYNVDFKRSVPSKVKELSEEVTGFANASGGYILIGVDNENNILSASIYNNKRSGCIFRSITSKEWKAIPDKSAYTLCARVANYRRAWFHFSQILK